MLRSSQQIAQNITNKDSGIFDKSIKKFESRIFEQ